MLSPRFDLYAWLTGTIESNAEDPRREERERILDDFRKEVTDTVKSSSLPMTTLKPALSPRLLV